MAAMTTESIDRLIQSSGTGVKAKLKDLYVYPDGHANLTFADGTNWPLADQYEVVQGLAGLLRRMQKAATAQARKKAR
jgi:hypothetical protein